MGKNEDMTDKIKQLIDRWAQESRNARNDGYVQEGYRGYIEEVRDYAARALDKDKKSKEAGKYDPKKWWKNKPT